MNKIKPAVLIGLFCMMLTLGISVQIKTIGAADISGSVKLTDKSLKKAVLQWKSKCDQSTNKLQKTNQELIDARNNATKVNSDEESLKQMKKYQIILGLTDVEGEGVIITVADSNQIDSSDAFANVFAADSIVHDGNLVAIVNELKSAGAEAISINDKRIVDSTCITCAGNVIQVNGEKVGSPFTIKAIGSKDLMYGELTKKEGTLYRLKMYGVITKITKEDNVKILKKDQ